MSLPSCREQFDDTGTSGASILSIEETTTCQPLASWPVGRRWFRLFLIAIGSCGLILLIVAGLLRPSPYGMGTHQQLGLPMCGFLLLTGQPCPSCGMTTSWSHLMRGQLLRSMQANAAGTWLGCWVFVLSLWVIFSGIRNRWMLAKPNEWFFLALLILTLILIISVWIFRIYF